MIPVAAIPLIWRVGAAGLAVLGSFAFGYYKGNSGAEARHKAEMAKALLEAQKEAEKMAKQDAEKSAKFAEERKSLQERQRMMADKISELLSRNPIYKECKIEGSVKDALNEVLQ